jgi:hypothetical protein
MCIEDWLARKQYVEEISSIFIFPDSRAHSSRFFAPTLEPIPKYAVDSIVKSRRHLGGIVPSPFSRSALPLLPAD